MKMKWTFFNLIYDNLLLICTFGSFLSCLVYLFPLCVYVCVAALSKVQLQAWFVQLVWGSVFLRSLGHTRLPAASQQSGRNSTTQHAELTHTQFKNSHKVWIYGAQN